MTNLLNLTHTTHNQYCEQEIAQARTVASPGDVFLLLSNDLRRTDWQRAPLAQRYLGHVIAADWAGLVDSWRNRLPSEMGLGEVKFAADTPLEGDGFEPLVPRHEILGIPAGLRRRLNRTHR